MKQSEAADVAAAEAGSWWLAFALPPDHKFAAYSFERLDFCPSDHHLPGTHAVAPRGRRTTLHS
jgi:hypothetical protein